MRKPASRFLSAAKSVTLLLLIFMLSGIISAMSKVPTITFNNGRTYPMFGLGTWKSKPGEVAQAVKDAINVGYRHLDCAHVYENEEEVGKGIAEKIADGTVKREDLYITSKLWNTYHKPELVEPALNVTLKNLGLTYLDMYLIHWPFAFKEGDELFPKTADNKIAYSDQDFVPTWKAMEALYKKGLVKNIGISNFNREQIERLLESAEVVPQTNQIECSPFLNQKLMSDFCRSKNITITAYSPLGSGDPTLLEADRFKEMARTYKKSVAQILIRYQIERGHIVIPKSVNKGRIAENMDIFDFELTEEDLHKLNNMEMNLRTCPFNETKQHKLYPFHAKF